MNEDTFPEPGTTPLPPEPDPLPESLPLAGTEPLPVAPRQRGWPLLAWVVIILLTSFAVFWQLRRREAEAGPTQEDAAGQVMFQMQARYLVGAETILGHSANLYEQARTFNTGPVGQRLRFITLAGELAGPEEALTQLRILGEKLAQQHIELTPPQADLENILRRLYRDYARFLLEAPSVSMAERQRLRAQLGWFGELALAPSGFEPNQRFALAVAGEPFLSALMVTVFRHADMPNPQERADVLDPARRTFWSLLAVFVLGVLVGLAGLVGLIILAILLLMGKLRGGLRCGSPDAGIYAETFALWMVVFAGLNIASEFLPSAVPRLAALALLNLLSLAVLAWPVVRGIPWRQVREAIGLTAGRQPVLEPLVGVGCYAMALPMLAVGVVLMLVLLWLQRTLAGDGPGVDSFGPSGGPTHPIIGVAAHADWWTWLQVFLVAAVVAPIVEETMFRGVLYRHLREATCRTRTLWSVLFSATVVSFLFAVVHPQGWVVVPALMALAFAFALAREWRGSLIAPVVAHGLNNGLLMVLLILAFGG
jgi:membrane protease YdiL (CAAX protease family)